jgi:hypothetical protein
MIHVAKEEDLKKLGRRGFLRMFGTTAASAVVAPTKTFVFFGDIFRPRMPVIPPFPMTKEGMMLKPEWWMFGIAGIVMGSALLLTPGKISNPG